MSLNQTETVECPKCGKKSPFTVWNSVNVTLDPSVKQDVLSGKIFLFHCVLTAIRKRMFCIRCFITILIIRLWFGSFLTAVKTKPIFRPG